MILLRDLRLAVRALAKTPVFTLSVLLCLGLGIGVTVAIFGVVYASLIEPLPYHQPYRLVMTWVQFLERGEEQVPLSGAEYVDVRDGNEVFSRTAALIPHIVNLTGEGEPERLVAGRVSASLFPLLGVEPAQGRAFLPEEDRVGGERVVLLTDGFWRRRFGGEASALGETLVLNGTPHEVVGVLPRDFELDGDLYELFIPVALDPSLLQSRREARAFKVFARLAPGTTIESAQANLDGVAHRLRQEYPAIYPEASGFGLRVTPLRDVVVGDVRPALLALTFAAVMVLVIACVNVGNLFLARRLNRQREVAVRIAFGAGRGAIVRELLSESLLLSLAGGVLGLILARWTLGVIRALEPEGVPRLDRVGVDPPVVAFMIGASLLIGLLLSLLAAGRGLPSVHEALQEGGRAGSEGRRSLRARRMLVVTEIALTLAVTTGAGLMGRTMDHLRRQDVGFARDSALVLQMWLPRARLADPDRANEFLENVRSRVDALPGTRSVAWSSAVPLESFRMWGRVDLEGMEPGRPAPTADWFMVGPEYFETMEIPLLQGRSFTDHDRRDGAQVAIVDEEFVRRHWPDRSPLGRRISLEGSQSSVRRIVGVVGQVRSAAPGEDQLPQIYVPYRQYPRPLMHLIVRTEGDPIAMARGVRETVWDLAPNQALSKNRTLEEIVSNAFSETRFQTFLFMAFAVISLALAVIGVYGLIAYTASRRSQEIGIRIALGAGRRTVLWSILKEGSALAGLGIVVGTPLALLVGKLMTGMVHGVGATDAATLSTVAGILALAVVLASVLPALRAASTSPVAALRQG